MTKMLDILEDYMRLRMFSFCRLDGQTAQEDRESQVSRYKVFSNRITDERLQCKTRHILFLIEYESWRTWN